MSKNAFFDNGKATLTCMVQGDNPDRIKELMEKSAPQGAEAFGIQFEQMDSRYRSKETYKELFVCAEDKPTYVTNYRSAKNEGKSDEQLADELLELAECGADLCDMMGDYFDKQPGEITYDETAVAKQKDLIDKLHKHGAKVLMSSHIFKFTPADEVLKIALSHQSRGADISKIVVGADNMEQQLENLRIINLLKEKLDIPFLFLSGGECKLLRRIGGELGCCMYLCVYEYDKFATPLQPLLKNIKAIRDNIR
ncbi:MAG: type I 3-dehydroquinate dehydratase [Clostridia bacterium]|nr:type I 3-dehydroquinate dehydratase [Clostridia bacterium]